MHVIRQIAVIGTGGVGGFFGAKLAQLQGTDTGVSVAFVARGPHLAAIRQYGLLVRTELEGEILCRPKLATDDFHELPPLDLCLVCVKEFDLREALARLKSNIGRDTIVLPLLNGVDVYERVRSVIKSGIVLRACVYVGTHIESAGVIAQRGGSCKILIGPDPMRGEWNAEELLRVLEGAGIKHEWTSEVEVEIWKKFAFICSFGLVTAAHNKTLGEALTDKSQELEGLIDEVIAVARASGIQLPENIAAETLEKGRGFPAEAKTSFQRDFEQRDKPDERDLFAGTLVRLARETGVCVPIAEKLAAKLDAGKRGGR